MIAAEQHSKTASEKKARIKERYKGINPDELEVIPAIPEEDFFNDTSEKRVAVYARVSTDDPNQTSSYELQKNHYTDMVNRHPGWNLVDIYADEGISGTSLEHRKEFVRMIDDCNAGKIDLIVTKTVARFARNILDCIGYARKLKAMNPAVGIFFETENIYTLNNNSEMGLSFIATLAQEESHNKSDIMNASIEMRFSRGIFLTPTLLGYDHDEDGNLVINEEEAKTVRLIFFMYLYGYSCKQIAEQLTVLHRPTKKGNTTWSPSTVYATLTNERHCGDVTARKTYTPNYLDHKSKKNRKNRNQYINKDHHEAIIRRDDFIAVQKIISNAKYGGNEGFLPHLTAVSSGLLCGFVVINLRWASFTVEDYLEASRSAMENSPPSNQPVHTPDDLAGYELVRSQFFDMRQRTSIRFRNKCITFSSSCVRMFSSEYVELLIHPVKRQIAIIPVEQNTRNAIRWSGLRQGIKIPRSVSGAAFLPRIYEICGWDKANVYRITGSQRSNGKESALIFDLEDSEIFIPRTNEAEAFLGTIPGSTKNYIRTLPIGWETSFGLDSLHLDLSCDTVDGSRINYSPAADLSVTPQDHLGAEINSLLLDMS